MSLEGFQEFCEALTRDAFRAQSQIQDGAILERSSRLNVVNYFRKKKKPQMLDWALNTPPQAHTEKLEFRFKI